ncbi:amidohydrolase family protein [candidate division KSB1 bacterium]|nr:amidohydrolase family protein [candidate division KSB1 bacterium]
MRTIYNCHAHIFTNQCVPEQFLPFGLIRFLSQQKFSQKLGRLLNRLNPRSNDDIFDRYAAFMNIGNYQSQQEIFNLLSGFYPQTTKYVLLSVDFDFMDAGKSPKSLLSQIEELAELKKDEHYRERIYPFICVDPRRKNIGDLVKEYIEEHHFAGIKMYPPLGFYPFDRGLDEVYEYAQSNKIPIISHCSKGGIKTHAKMSKQIKSHPKTGVEFKNEDEVKLSFAHPDNYRYVLDRYPDVKIDLAHLGGGPEVKNYLVTPWYEETEKSWFSAIIDLIRESNNIFSDVSYTMHEYELLPVLSVILSDPKVRTRILYGSDFYMVEMDKSERAFSMNLRSYIGEDNFWQIAETNPEEFLNITA